MKKCEYEAIGRMWEAIEERANGKPEKYLSLIGMSEEEYKREVLDPAWKWCVLGTQT